MTAQKRSFSAKLIEGLSLVAYWPRTFRLIWQAAPSWTLAWSILLIVQGALPVISVYLIKILVDSLVFAVRVGGGWSSARPVIYIAALAALIMLATEFLQSMTEWVRMTQSELVQDHIKNLIHRQAANVDLAFYDSAEYHDRLEQALSEAGSRPLSMLESFGGLIQNSITLVAMAVVLIPYGAWLPLGLLASTIPAFLVVLRFDRIYHRWWQSVTPIRRWIQYFDVMLTHARAASEVRVFGTGDHFRSQYQSLRKRMRNERSKQMRQLSFGKLGSSAVAVLVIGAMMLWMVFRALQGSVTLGDLALFYQAFTNGQSLMRSLLGSVGKILTNSLFLGNLFAFLDLKPVVTDPSQPEPAPMQITKGIEFRHLAFSYPGSDTMVFKDFNLKVPAGKVVAIVGVNGAGKSTLIKLLCRFYDPLEGSIELDGKDLRSFGLKDLWRLITVTFQMPLNYHATVRDSIALGDLEARPSDKEIQAAAIDAGADEFISRLPHNYDTLLGKVHADGAELSGGEWQRIALARAYLRKSPIILLDEPTSYIDSWAEADWFQRFRRLAQGRTSIVITHRFTIAMRADIIHVMDAGQIVESGTHHELLEQDGLYAQSWRAQVAAASPTVKASETLELVNSEW